MLAAALLQGGEVEFQPNFYGYDEIARMLTTAGQPTQVSDSIKQRGAFIRLKLRSTSEVTAILCKALDLEIARDGAGHTILEANSEVKRREKDFVARTLKGVDGLIEQRLHSLLVAKPLERGDQSDPNSKVSYLDRLAAGQPGARTLLRALDTTRSPLSPDFLRRTVVFWNERNLDLSAGDLHDLGLETAGATDAKGSGIAAGWIQPRGVNLWFSMEVSMPNVIPFAVTVPLTIDVNFGGAHIFSEQDVGGGHWQGLGNDGQLWIKEQQRQTRAFLHSPTTDRDFDSDPGDLSGIIKSWTLATDGEAVMELSPSLETDISVPAGAKAGFNLAKQLHDEDGWTIVSDSGVLEVKNQLSFLEHALATPIARLLRLLKSRRLEQSNRFRVQLGGPGSDFRDLPEFADLRSFYSPDWSDPSEVGELPPRNFSSNGRIYHGSYHGEVVFNLMAASPFLFLWDSLPEEMRQSLLSSGASGRQVIPLLSFDRAVLENFANLDTACIPLGPLSNRHSEFEKLGLDVKWDSDPDKKERYRINLRVVDLKSGRNASVPIFPFAYHR